MPHTLTLPALQSRQRRAARPWAGRVGLYAFLFSAALFFLLPLYVMVVTSLKTLPELRAGSMLALPAALNFDAWFEAWSSACVGMECTGIAPGFWNSVKILVPSVAITIGVAALNGYALAQWKFPHADKVMMLIALGIFLPHQVVLLPLLKMFAAVNLQGSLVAIVAVHVLFGLPFLTLLFRNYYSNVPQDLMRAALMDGGGFWSIFLRIMLPMSVNILLVALILQFTSVWNDYLLGLMFAGRDNLPMTVLLNNIVNAGTGEVRFNVNMAATLLTAIPPLFVYFLSGEYFVRGITSGATKG